MFTINIYLKFALIAICLFGGIGLWFAYGFGYAWLPLLIGILLLLSYILLGTVQSASVLVQSMDFESAEKRLGLTFKPGWLYVTNRAFYYIMSGTIAANKSDNKLAEDHFNTALSLKLPSDNEKAMVLMQLANIKGTKGNWKAATNYFKEAQKLNVTQSEIKNQLAYFEKALTQNKAQMKTARSMGKDGMRMMRQGGSSKRRRPKMR